MDAPNTATQNFIMQLSMARRPSRRAARRARPHAAQEPPSRSARTLTLPSRVPLACAQGSGVLDSLHVTAYRMDPLFLIHHIQTLTYMARATPRPRHTRAACTVGGVRIWGFGGGSGASRGA